jgi:hypothetical protein
VVGELVVDLVGVLGVVFAAFTQDMGPNMQGAALLLCLKPSVTNTTTLMVVLPSLRVEIKPKCNKNATATLQENKINYYSDKFL